MELNQVDGLFDYHEKPGLLNLFNTAKDIHDNFKDTKHYKKECKDAEVKEFEKAPHGCLVLQFTIFNLQYLIYNI